MRLGFFGSLLTALALALPACSNPSAGDNSSAGATILTAGLTASCQSFIRQLSQRIDELPGGFMGFLNSPEDPAQPNGRMIRIFYYGHVLAGQTPVVFFNGGPGGSSHSAYWQLTARQKLSADWTKIPFVFLDQRGTGCSDGYPQGQDPATLLRLSHYGSRGIVADAELVRRTLGYKKWKVFGQSYGAYIVHRYAVVAPDSITAAYAHADVISNDPMLRLVDRIDSQNQVLEDYLTDFPSDRAVLTHLDSALTSVTCFQNYKQTERICGRYVVDRLFSQLGFVDSWMTLHVHLNLLEENGKLDTAHLQEYLQNTVFSAGNSETSDPGTGSETPAYSDYPATVVIGWVDRNNALAPTYNNCLKVFDALHQRNEHPETWLFSECATAYQFANTKPDALADLVRATMVQDPLTIRDLKASLQAHPGMPFFLYAGAKDPYVPASEFADELQALQSLVHYTYFVDTGHDGYNDEPQVWEDLISL